VTFPHRYLYEEISGTQSTYTEDPIRQQQYHKLGYRTIRIMLKQPTITGSHASEHGGNPRRTLGVNITDSRPNYASLHLSSVGRETRAFTSKALYLYTSRNWESSTWYYFSPSSL